MLHLTASADIKLLEKYEGRNGRFVKTFLLSDKRNLNGWRTDYSAILKDGPDFVGFHGIEYLKCEQAKCTLDHTDASTYEQNLEIQKPYHITDIVDVVINDQSKMAFAIHEINSDEVWEKFQTGKLRYVSPSIWPKQGQYKVLGKTERGHHKIDVLGFKPIHLAFVETPAYTTENAGVYGMCDGESSDCIVKLQASLEADENTTDELAPLKEVPLLVKHKGKHVFASAPSCVQDIVMQKVKDGKFSDRMLAEAYEECAGTKDTSTVSTKAMEKPMKKAMTCECNKAKRLQAKVEKLEQLVTAKINKTLKAATPFKPEKGKKPDKDGKYWFTNTYGIKYWIKEGMYMEDALREQGMKEQIQQVVEKSRKEQLEKNDKIREEEEKRKEEEKEEEKQTSDDPDDGTDDDTDDGDDKDDDKKDEDKDDKNSDEDNKKDDKEKEMTYTEFKDKIDDIMQDDLNTREIRDYYEYVHLKKDRSLNNWSMNPDKEEKLRKLFNETPDNIRKKYDTKLQEQLDKKAPVKTGPKFLERFLDIFPDTGEFYDVNYTYRDVHEAMEDGGDYDSLSTNNKEYMTKEQFEQMKNLVQESTSYIMDKVDGENVYSKMYHKFYDLKMLKNDKSPDVTMTKEDFYKKYNESVFSSRRNDVDFIKWNFDKFISRAEGRNHYSSNERIDELLDLLGPKTENGGRSKKVWNALQDFKKYAVAQTRKKSEEERGVGVRPATYKQKMKDAPKRLKFPRKITADQADAMVKVWNAMPPKIRKDVEYLKINSPNTKEGKNTHGSWGKSDGRLLFNVSPRDKQSSVRHTMSHEMGHVGWSQKVAAFKTTDKGKARLNEWKKFIDELGAVSPYAEYYANDKGNFQESSKSRDGEDGALHIYYNENHSEVVSSMYDLTYEGFFSYYKSSTNKHELNKWGDKYKQRLTKARQKYVEIFGESDWGAHDTLTAMIAALKVLSAKLKIIKHKQNAKARLDAKLHKLNDILSAALMADGKDGTDDNDKPAEDDFWFTDDSGNRILVKKGQSVNDAMKKKLGRVSKYPKPDKKKSKITPEKVKEFFKYDFHSDDAKSELVKLFGYNIFSHVDPITEDTREKMQSYMFEKKPFEKDAFVKHDELIMELNKKYGLEERQHDRQIFADAYNDYISEKIKSNSNAYRFVAISEIIDIIKKGEFRGESTESSEPEMKSFTFNVDHDYGGQFSNSITIPYNDLPNPRPLKATPFNRHTKTSVNGIFVESVDSLQQEELRVSIGQKIPRGTRLKIKALDKPRITADLIKMAEDKGYKLEFGK